MSIRIALAAVSAVGLVVAAARLPQTGSAASRPRVSAHAPTQSARARYARLPVSFERNDGQVDASVRYLASGAGYNLFLTETETVVSLRAPTRQHDGMAASPVVVRMSLQGANPHPHMQGEGLQAGKTHYLRGNDPARGTLDADHVARVHVDDVYPGVGVSWYGTQSQLEYDINVAPGADPRRIAIDFSGADAIRLDAGGNLVVEAQGARLVQQKPVVYQRIAGQRRRVEGAYRLLADRRVGIDIGPYDHSRLLVIDPVLAYGSYLGGSGEDDATSLAVDAAGNLYVAGYAYSPQFPVKGALQAVNAGGSDVVVSKFNADNDGLVYSTYIGGSGDDSASDILVDGSGNVTLAGETTSLDFPVKSAFRSTHAADGGLKDGFVLKLGAAGNALVYSTYLGGSGNDQAFALAAGATGSTFVAGMTCSTDFPLKNPVQVSVLGCDGFITRFDSTGASLLYSSPLGGSGWDVIYGLAVDANGNLLVAGTTMSTDFPNSFGQTLSGSGDAFVAKLPASGAALTYSRLLGGHGTEDAFDLVVNAHGNAIVVGRTKPPTGVANDFPVYQASQETAGGATDAFIANVDASGAVISSSYFGGTGDDVARRLVMNDGTAVYYVTGYTTSTDLPGSKTAQATNGGGRDAFVAHYDYGDHLQWVSYFGGSADDSGLAAALYGSGNVYLAGWTGSSNLPTVMPYDVTAGGGLDAFIARIGLRGFASYTHDFNHDFAADVLWHNRTSGGNSIWDSGDSAVTQPVTTVTNVAWTIPGVGDFNGDGIADMLWRNVDTGANIAWLSGNSASTLPVATVSNLSWSVAGIGDFDGDGSADLLWHNSQSGANVIWLGANSATTRAVATVSNLDWHVAGIGDFDGDGQSDVLWRNVRSGANVVWRAGSSSATLAVKATDPAWSVAGIGDFYADGKSDIFWRNNSTGANVIWRSGSSTTTQPVAAVTNLAWVVAAVGDYDGDARSDVFWRNGSTGANVIWLSANAAHVLATRAVTNPDWVVVR